LLLSQESKKISMAITVKTTPLAKNLPKKSGKAAKKRKLEKGAIIKNDPKNYPQTGQWSSHKFVVGNKCIGCGLCTTYCPEGAIKLVKIGSKSKAVIDPTFCKGCGICAEECPVKAISKHQKNVEK
jgi:pyruvate ferredoxin oxidoreductase delta subunit